MDADSARKVLKVGRNASMDDIRRRFRYLAKILHPDVPETGDAKQFILISTAYYTLQADNLGFEANTELQQDLSSAFFLKTAIEEHINTAKDSFTESLDRIESETLHRLRRTIETCDSRAELQEALDAAIPSLMNNANAKLRVNAKRLAKDIGEANSDYLFEVFREMYRENRKYWLINLYRNKAVVLGLAGEAGTFLLTEIPSLYVKLPQLSSVASSLGLLYVIPLVSLATLSYQFVMLNPRRQFLPPALSAAGVHTLITKEKDGLPHTPTENAIAGGVLGGVAAFLSMDPFGLVLVAIGSLIGGRFGKKMETIKDEVYTKIASHFSDAIDDIRHSIEDWAEKTKAGLYEASMSSIGRNLKQISGMVERKRIGSGIIPDESRPVG